MYLFGREISGFTDDEVTIRGDAELRQFGASVQANEIAIDFVESKVKASGEVVLFREGEFYKGTGLTLKPYSMEGVFEAADYEFSAMNARGSAAVIEFVKPKLTQLTKASFTTCPRDRPAWVIQADSLLVDQVREVSFAAGSVLLWRGVPVVPLGDFSFPSSDRRRSGFLAPTYAANTDSGIEVSVPYYWNIAPNRDMTLIPKLMSRRGIQLAGEFRYLDPAWVGVAEWEFLPIDHADPGRSNRSFARIRHRQSFDSATEIRLHATRVSDDRYLTDFGASLLASSQRTLPASLAVDTQRFGWQFSLIGQEFQLIDDPLAPLISPYHLAPKFTASKAVIASQVPFLDKFGPLDSSARLEWASLSHPTLIDGDRFVIEGELGLPKDLGPVVTNSKLIIHATHFQGRGRGSGAETNRRFGSNWDLYRFNVAETPGVSRSYQRVIPTMSFESRLIFERDIIWARDRASQTLEPRLLYVRTPYRDQSTYPVFDTGPETVGLGQLLSDRVYRGSDRVADQNHLTTAVTSRVISGVSGEEVFSGTVAQRHYFQNQRVTLPGEPSREDLESDVLAEVTLRYSRALSGKVVAQYTPSPARWQAGSASVAYTPRAGQVISGAYRYQRETFDSIDFAFQAPIRKHWYAVGRFNYSFQDNDAASALQREGLVEGLLGAEYDGGCWVGRIVFQQFVSRVKSETRALYFQIELNGLGRVGTDPLSALRRGIPNYSVVNKIHSPSARFENFQ